MPAPGTPERLRYAYWMHYAEGSAMPPLLLRLIFDRIEPAPMPFFVHPVAKAIAGKAKSGFVEPNIRKHLDSLEAASARGGLDQSRRNLMDFLKRIHARPAYQRALERGGKYELLR